MHLSLQITEILTNIFELYDDDKQGRNTLLHLALVCKTFHEPALDALWVFQRSFLTLVKTFPDDLWEETGEPIKIPGIQQTVPSGDLMGKPSTLVRLGLCDPYGLVDGVMIEVTERPTTLSFRRPLTVSDWPRFQLYAKRMKHLSFQRSTDPFRIVSGRPELDPYVLHAIDNSLDLGHCHRPILPNLNELTWGFNFVEIFLRNASIFLGPRLTILSLSPPPRHNLWTFLTAVKSNCCSLEVLQIDVEFDISVGKMISNIVCGLPRLREALFSGAGVPLTLEALVHLASLPMMRKLLMSLPNGPVLRASQNAFPSLPFPALRNFHAYVRSIADCDEFLQLISSSSNLESLTIHTIIPPPQELYTFLTTVHQSSSCDTLTTISLCDTSEIDEDAPSHFLATHTLLPLLQCPNVENLSIHLGYRYGAIDNSLMEAMALAWPYLRKLSLVPHPHGHSSINLGGLLHLAQHCCILKSVSHEFDISLPMNLMDSSKRPGAGIRNESMTHLWVNRSRITNPPAVAAFLSDVFPNLTLNHCWHFNESDWDSSDDEDDPDFKEMCKRWEEVDNLLSSDSGMKGC